MLPAIPQELSDMILDFLHNDKAALCSAGLVCKSWLPGSRFHLFSEIYWELSDQVLELICAEGSTIPPYILKLEGNKSQISDETLLRLPLLNNLKYLRLLQINMANLTPDAKMKLTTMLKNVENLHLLGFTFETVDQAVDFIASAPCLEDIDLSDVDCSESCNYASQAVAPPLRSIRYKPGPLGDNLMDWFCRCHPKPYVHTLDIYRLTFADNILTVCNLIRHMGSALEHLMISLTDSDGVVRTALSQQIDLSQKTSLRNITFHKIRLYENKRRSRSCGWITSIVSSLAHPSLEFVTLVIYIGDVKEIEVLELSALENLFLKQPLSNNSTKLCFHIVVFGSSIDRESVQAALEDRLPKLYEEKRLEFNRFRTYPFTS